MNMVERDYDAKLYKHTLEAIGK